MEAEKDDEKSASKPQSSMSLEQTARSKMRDLKPEKDPMGGRGVGEERSGEDEAH